MSRKGKKGYRQRSKVRAPDPPAAVLTPIAPLDLKQPPPYCQYAEGACDQLLAGTPSSDGLFLYASTPPEIASTIETAVARLRSQHPDRKWRTWRDLPIEGQIIFCEVCKASRFSEAVLTDVTTLNFNLLFEIGFALGLRLPVIPIRDSSVETDRKAFEALGLLDTLGYIDFRNSDELASSVAARLPAQPLPLPPAKSYVNAPLYILKSPIPTDGSLQMFSTLKKSFLRFRQYDPIETPRLTLFEAQRQVSGSVGVIAHLLGPDRTGAVGHNGRCALLCGMAMAQQKVVVMLQEGEVVQPLDYRDVVQSYSNAADIPALLDGPIHQVVAHLQSTSPTHQRAPARLLELLDLGDTAAENEIAGLDSYFVRTGQYRQALQGHARLVVGRKGAGKTALFYEIRNSLGISRSHIILDLRPEGHQFTRLREVVIDHLATGGQEHVVTAFWNYILLAELAHSILRHDRSHAQRDPDRLRRYKTLEEVYREHDLESDQDLSQRLLRQVERVAERLDGMTPSEAGSRVAELVYGGDVHQLSEAVSDYLADKDEVVILIDNLDKSWPTRGTSPTDILILRGLLEASRKLQRQLEAHSVVLKCLVFLRTDVYEHLLQETPDKGKDTAIRLDWDDPAVFEQIIDRRIEVSTLLKGSFREKWRELAESHIGPEDSFNYLLERTLMRPRDLLMFVQRAVEVALNRGHTRITAEDIRQAEGSFSEDMLIALGQEIHDTQPDVDDVLYAFIGSSSVMAVSEVEELVRTAGVSDNARRSRCSRGLAS